MDRTAKAATIVIALCIISSFGECMIAPSPHHRHGSSSGSSSYELSIIHFSDFHGRFVPVSSSPDGGLCYAHEKDEKCVGGIARVASVVKRLEKIRPNPIFLNAGDCFQGTLYYDVHRGNITAYFMNKLPHDAITIGNHDFDDGISGLVSYVEQLLAPVVVTNIDSSKEPSMSNIYTNSTIVRKGGKDIGIIGALFSGTDKISSFTGKLQFEDEVATVNLEAEKLKARGVDIILVLSHCGIEHDKIMAANCPDVDVIVGGHSHILLYNGTPPSKEQAYGEYPLVVTQAKTERRVLIVHSSAFTKYMGDIRIVFDERGEVAHWKGNPIYLDKNIKEDQTILDELKPWKAAVDRIGKRVIGETVVFLNGTCASGECNLANFITDAMVDKYDHDKASIGFVTANSIQNSIPKGKILYEDIYATMPYNNTWDLIELRGSDLLQVLEENVAVVGSADAFENSKLILWSGLEVVYNLSSADSRVVSVQVRCPKCKMFEDLESNKWYKVVVPAYLLTADFPTIASKHRNHVAGTTNDIDNLIAYVEKVRVVNSTIESRMVFV